MKKLGLVIIGLCVGLLTQAQDSYLLNYEWEAEPTIHELTEDEQKESAIYLEHNIAVESFYTKEGGIIEYFMEHRIIHLNDADGVDEFNKVYMPGSFADPDKYVIVELARVIKPDGKVIEMDQNDILEEVNEEEDRTYRYFAFEGVEVGDEVEYMFIYPRPFKANGAYYHVQSQVFRREATVSIITPKNLENRFMSLNGFPEMEEDEEWDDRNFYTATVENVPRLEKEKYSAYNANRMGVAYYLYKNTSNNMTFDLYSTISKNLGEIVSAINPKKSGVIKFLKKLEMDEGLSDEDKIIFLENHVKRTYVYKEGKSGVLPDLLKNKYGGDLAFIRLYAAVFDQWDIEYEIVNTCSRYDHRFQKDFKCQMYIPDILFYFPDTKKYMSPTGLLTRYGFPPSQLMDNDGLYVRFMNIGGAKSGIGKVKRIKAVPSEASSDNFTISMTIDELPGASLHLHKELTGYNALTNYQTLLELMGDESVEEITEAMVTHFDEDMELDDVEVKNATSEDFGKKPLVIEADFTSENFIKKAGNNYLINVGMMIGPQAELYTEEERQLPVSNGYNREYHRTLIINVPEGYELANLEDLNMNITYDKDGEKDMGFTSSYTLEGDVLTVKVDEWYGSIEYTVEEYANFEKVLNAAADFNKLTVLLKKK
jgi:hypothetical protein